MKSTMAYRHSRVGGNPVIDYPAQRTKPVVGYAELLIYWIPAYAGMTAK